MVGLARLRRYSGEDLDRAGSAHRVFLDRERSHGALRESQRSGLIAKAHIGQCQIANHLNVFWLFFEKSFQFAAGLPPTLLSGGTITTDFLSPALPKAQLGIDITQCRIGLAQYFF